MLIILLNSNIRCIEMYNDLVKIYTEARLNSNIRCIEMREEIKAYRDDNVE